MNLYNEIDPYCADWLRSLVQSQLIPPGHVDERPIQDVPPKDLAPYIQCHFFAGLGGWPQALALAGIGPDRPLWTGSCPCQSFSQAGQSRGFADERHLWPFWFHLIEQSRPDLVFGEQVSSKLALEWFDLVHSDLESAGYAVGVSDLCAAGVGAPHIRQRLWFVADANEGRSGRNARAIFGAQAEAERRLRGEPDGSESGGAVGELGDTRGPRLQERECDGRIQREALESSEGQAAIGGSDAGGMVNSESEQVGLSRRARQSRISDGELGDAEHGGCEVGQSAWRRADATLSPSSQSFWTPCDWLPCTDGKARPVEPGTFPLAHGVPARVAKLRALGNAIVPQVAAAFIKAALTRFLAIPTLIWRDCEAP